MTQAGSAHHSVPQPTLHSFIGKQLWAEFSPAEFGTLLLVAQEPRVLWQKGDNSWIQLVKGVQKSA